MAATAQSPFNRHTGLLVIEVRTSNPNGDPDLESDPRTLEGDGRGLISPVSVKRKLRDLVSDWDSSLMAEARERLALGANGDMNQYKILESRGRATKELKDITNQGPEEFKKLYWDARIFGNTMLEAMQEARVARAGPVDHFIATGVVQFGVGVSIAPVKIIRWTQTNVGSVQLAKEGSKDKQDSQGDKDRTRGMAPLSFRVIEHGIYAMPFFVNPMVGKKTGATLRDLKLMEFLLPNAYALTASVTRAFVFPIHCWYAEHKSPWGSCPDPQIIDALTPRRLELKEEPSSSSADYAIPTESDLPDVVRNRLKSITDLCQQHT
ncbi:MAG: type I CRISPR-associated protein Cas7 [Gemmatimonadaceae bacterium]